MSDGHLQVIDEAASLALGRAMHLGVVGLGQCGGNIADAFAARHYPTIAVNSSAADLAELSHVPAALRVKVGTSSAHGAGGSLSLGGEALRSGADTIAELLEQVFEDVELVIVVGGLGGGMGGNLVELAGLVAELDFPVVAMGVMPGVAEGYRVKSNALWAINELVDAPIDSLILVDNEKLFTKHGDLTVERFWPTCNESLVRVFDELNSFAGKEELRSVRTFDPNDLRQLLRFGGTVLFGSRRIEGDVTPDALLLAFMETLNNNEMLATGIDVEDVVVAGSVVVAGTERLGATSASVFDDYFREVKLVTSGAAHRFGLYRSDNEGPAHLHVIAAGMPLPGRVHDMLAEATAEAQQFGSKKSQARVRLKRLDLSPLGVGTKTESPEAPPATAATGGPPVVHIEEAAPLETSESPTDSSRAVYDARPDLSDDELLPNHDADEIESMLSPPSRILADEG